MQCDQTREWYEDWIEDNSVLLPSTLQEHLSACRTCRDLVALIQTSQANPESTDDILERLRTCVLMSGPTPGQLDSLRERIRKMILSDLAPVKPRPPLRSLMLGVAASMLGGAAATAIFTGDAGLHRLSFDQVTALLVLAVLVLSAFSYVLTALIVPGSPRRFRPSKALLLSAAGVALTFGLFFDWNLEQGLSLSGARCSRGILVGSVPTLVFLWAVLRRGSVLEPVISAAMIVAAAGIGGLIAVQLACPLQEASHLLIWHAGPWLLLVAGVTAGVWVFRRMRH